MHRLVLQVARLDVRRRCRTCPRARRVVPCRAASAAHLSPRRHSPGSKIKLRRLSLFSSSGSGNSGNSGGGQLNGVADAPAHPPAPAMFSKLKGAGGGGAAGHSPLDTNPITQYFEVGKQTASAGPGLIWKIYDAVRKSDRKVSGPETRKTQMARASLSPALGAQWRAPRYCTTCK